MYVDIWTEDEKISWNNLQQVYIDEYNAPLHLLKSGISSFGDNL